MKRDDISPVGYIDLFRARVGACASIPQSERNVHVRPVEGGKTWLIGRGELGKELFDDVVDNAPLQLKHGGTLELFVKVMRDGTGVRVPSYRLIFNVPENENGISTIRYDHSDGHKRGLGWDDDLLDNTEHPQSHLHINYDKSVDANSLRMPIAGPCPIVTIRAFDYWYVSTFG